MESDIDTATANRSRAKAPVRIDPPSLRPPWWRRWGAGWLFPAHRRAPAAEAPPSSPSSLLRRLRQKSDLPVIFLTSKDEEIDELFGLKMGADDFIRKPFSQRLLVERVKAVLRRAIPKDGSAPKETDSAKVLERGQLRMDPERHTCTWKNEPVTLTVTEFLILQALASRPGVVKSRNALMDAAYDDQVYVDDRTIDSHIKRLRKKFKGSDDDFDMIETLYGVGYRFKEM